MPRLALAVASLVAALLVASAAPAKEPQLLGLVGAKAPLRLAALDPKTLAPVGTARVAIGSGGRYGGEACWATPPWTREQGGSLLAFARNDEFTARSLVIVNPDQLAVTEQIPLFGAPVGALAWLAPGRLLAVQEVCCNEIQRLLVVDVASGKVLSRRSLGGTVVRVGRTSNALVLLLSPALRIGTARLAVVAAGGAIRFATLRAIDAGTKQLGAGYDVARQQPGLAVDQASRRVFVVGRTSVAEVDLRTLAVSSHVLRQPAVAAKETHGSSRTAGWLGGSMLAISGEDDGPGGVHPAGLRLVDTRTWSARDIDSSATGFTVAEGLILATGSSSAPTGLAVYDRTGTLRFRLFAGMQAWGIVADGAGRAYVGLSTAGGADRPTQIVDLASGRVVGERTTPPPTLLLGAAGSWWED